MSDIIDINIYPTVETVSLTIAPNLTTINVNTITGGGGSGVQSVVAGTNISVNNTDPNNPIVSATGLVPYTGATQDVNLGEFGLLTGNLEFDLTPTNVPTAVGSMVWNDTAGTLDLKLKGGAVTLQIGQETVARVVNKTATNITLLESNYQIVRVTGAQGQRPKVDLALANNDLNSTTTLGLVTETILNNQEGFITTSGQVQEINTTGSLQGETWADGDVLYLSGTVAGQATNIKPTAPIHTVIIGFVEYVHINQGKIFVKVDNGYELEELHNVSAIAPNNNEVLTYDSATLLWKPKTVANATETVAGIAEIATTSEVSTGTDDTRIVTPLKLKAVTDLKQNQILIAKKTINSTALTGTTAEGILESIFIPANTYAVGDIMKIINAMNKTGTAGNSLLRTRINIINSLTGSVIISTGGAAASNVLSGANPERHFNIRSGNLIEGYPFTIGGVFENGNANVQRTSTTFDPTQDVYLLLTAQLGSASDSIVNAQYLLEKY